MGLAQRSVQWNERMIQRLKRPRRATRGYSQIPNALIENAGLFPRSEYSFLEGLYRRGKRSTLSDINFADWNDVDPRMKEMAIAGLLKNGIIEVDGFGQSARYTVIEEVLFSFIESQPRGIRGRTAGRKKTVATAKPDMHPDCRARGCQKAAACEPEPASNLFQFPHVEIAKPVSQTETVNPPENIPPTPTAETSKPKSETKIPPKKSGGVDYPLALAAVRKYYAHVDAGFTKQLCLKIQEAGITGYTDYQLAQSIHQAAAAKRNSQLSEGLFLLTVPPRLARTIAQMQDLEAKTRKDQQQQHAQALKSAREILSDPAGDWGENLAKWAKDVLKE